MLCAYKDTFGEPREGVHAIRMWGDLAAVDVVLTLVGPLLLVGLVKPQKPLRAYVRYTLTLVVCGIVLHRLFCVRTTIDRLLFQS